MKEVLAELRSARANSRDCAIATVVRTQRSAPKPDGTAMLVTDEGEAIGSVSGGCVEGAVYELAGQVLNDGTPRLEQFGFSDDDAFAVGLTCGGIIDIFIERIDGANFDGWETLAQCIEEDRPVAIATIIEHADPRLLGRKILITPDDHEGSLGDEILDHVIATDARGLLAAGTTTTVEYGPAGERMDSGMRVFVQSFQPRPRMLIFGAIDFAAALAESAAFVGFHVTVCDARPVFATAARFPKAHDVVVSWPHKYLDREAAAGRIDQRSVLCVLTHDAKFDVPVLKSALALQGLQRPAYIGAMGSRTTHADRSRRLLDAGVLAQDVARLRSPIGLDLGGRTTEETAISIIAEVIALRHGGTGEPLTGLAEPIHT